MMDGGHVFGGRYRAVAVLGEGGMARVYRALDERLGRVVAVKALHAHYAQQPEFIARFQREARLAARLTHPHIVAVHDIGRDDDGTHYMVLEYVAGETLRSLIARAAPLALTEAVALCRQLGQALDDAHQHGVIHRDIKPANIFVTPQRHVKVGDFGIARALDATPLTGSGTVLGSAPYVAPEQAQGAARPPRPICTPPASSSTRC